MYICEICGVVTEAGVKQARTVVKTCECEHPLREKAYPNGNADPGGKGTQIVMEAVVCPSCAV